MSLSIAHHALPFSRQSEKYSAAWSPHALRTLLLLGCLASVAATAWIGDPSAYVRADPELAFLLRGMAAIKACLVVASVGVSLWRLGHALPQSTAAAYLVGSWLMAGATMLIWQLSFIALAALVFHVGMFMLLFVAWRDQGVKLPRFRDAL